MILSNWNRSSNSKTTDPHIIEPLWEVIGDLEEQVKKKKNNVIARSS